VALLLVQTHTLKHIPHTPTHTLKHIPNTPTHTLKHIRSGTAWRSGSRSSLSLSLSLDTIHVYTAATNAARCSSSSKHILSHTLSCAAFVWHRCLYISSMIYRCHRAAKAAHESVCESMCLEEEQQRFRVPLLYIIDAAPYRADTYSHTRVPPRHKHTLPHILSHTYSHTYSLSHTFVCRLRTGLV
jgi:hypothetical protein